MDSVYRNCINWASFNLVLAEYSKNCDDRNGSTIDRKPLNSFYFLFFILLTFIPPSLIFQWFLFHPIRNQCFFNDPNTIQQVTFIFTKYSHLVIIVLFKYSACITTYFYSILILIKTSIYNFSGDSDRKGCVSSSKMCFNSSDGIYQHSIIDPKYLSYKLDERYDKMGPYTQDRCSDNGICQDIPLKIVQFLLIHVIVV
ncbi:hypothetical protein ACTA71_009287 [Dictyostelium dimigraforme]